MILAWGARRGTRGEAGLPEKAKVEEVAERLHLRFHTELGANMREEFILGIKFIVLIMVTHNSTLLGTLPPIPTNGSLFII